MKRDIPPIRFEKDYLSKLINEENSCVEVQEQKYHLELHPYHLTNINESIKDILNRGIAKYDKVLGGILLGYQDIKLLSDVGAVMHDSFFMHAEFIASFYMFKPQVGSVLNGIVNKKSEDHVGCLVHKTFNVSLPKPEDDDDWVGLRAGLGSEIQFRITCMNLEARLPYIRAELVSILAEDDSGFSTSEDTRKSKKIKPKKIRFESEDEQNVDLSESIGKKKKKKHKKLEVDFDAHEEQDGEEIENTKNSKKKKSKHKYENLDASVENNDQKDKKKKHKHKHEHPEQELSEEDISEGISKDTSKKKKNKKEKLEELPDAVLQRTLLSVSDETKKKKKKHKNKADVWEDSLNETLPELDLNRLFEKKEHNKSATNDHFVMADNEDKAHKKRRISGMVADYSAESKLDLNADSDLERIFKDVEKSHHKKGSGKGSSRKRQLSTSSTEFEMPKKKSKKIH